MRMRWLWCLTGVFLYLGSNSCAPARADFICRSDVSYKWVKADPAKSTPEPKPASSAETTVRFAAVERSGVDEAGAKASLEPELNKTKVRATEACKKEHENLAGCIAGKFSIQSSTLAGLSFTARRELEKAITADCQAQLGTCLTALSSDPACEEIKKLETPTAAPEKGADKKKK